MHVAIKHRLSRIISLTIVKVAIKQLSSWAIINGKPSTCRSKTSQTKCSTGVVGPRLDPCPVQLKKVTTDDKTSKLWPIFWKKTIWLYHV